VGFWDTVFINPMINSLVVLARLLVGNLGLAIIVFTMLMRLATLPLTIRQLHASRRMQELQPRLKEINNKYKDPKRRQEETMKLYKEAGVNPIGCLGPMIIQFPIWFALYRALEVVAAGTPERLTELAHRLYPWGFIQDAVPLSTHFLWMDLGRVDHTYILFVLVAATTWLQTKLSMTQATVGTGTQQQTNQMMLWMMPLMFAWFTLTVPSGLSLYWVATNLIGIVMNWFVYGWHKRPLREVFVSPGATPARRRPRAEQPAVVASGGTPAETSTTKRALPNGGTGKRTADGQRGDKRKDGGGGGRQGTQATRSGPLPGRRRDR
jgi:YidC/Oxa1 family membrane protein insertase